MSGEYISSISLSETFEDATDRLERYLSYEKVCSGEALKAARSDYQTVARKRAIDNALPGAWSALLKEPDSPLLDLLADKVEDLCGYKPDSALCSRFLERVSKPGATPTVPIPAQSISPAVKKPKRPEDVHKRSAVSFVFRGKAHESTSAREVMCNVFRLLAKEDPGFLERFAVRKHSKKRRYLAQDRQELYPGRPDLAEDFSTEVAPGWWLGTNYSRRGMQKILDLALEVVHPSLRSVIQVSIDS